MAFIAISGEPGCRQEELARLVAQRLECLLVTEPALEKQVAQEFGESVPDRAWPWAAAFVLMREADLVVCGHWVEMLRLPGISCFRLAAPESLRLRNLMSECNLSRPAAKARLRRMAERQAEARKRRFGIKTSPVTAFHLIANEQALGLPEIADLLISALRSQNRADRDLSAAEAQFQVRMQLARYGLVSSLGKAPPEQARAECKVFGHPSEQVFANLLDFYGIAWDYEPRSFPLQWDKDGKVSEAFTPDFYLPEFDLYVELTTMKQSNVTRKNRKIRLLRAIYPHVNIQVFYQKDVQDLVMKYRPRQHA